MKGIDAFVGLVLILSAVLLSGCPDSKTVVKKVSPSGSIAGTTMSVKKKPLDGIFYSLPRTVVRATVPVKRTESSPGRYPKYAMFLFPDDDAVTEPNIKFKLEKPVFEAGFEPDPDEIYYVGIKSKFFQSKTLFAELSESGIFSAAKSKVEDQTPAIVGAAVKTAASIVGIPLSRRGIVGLDATTRGFDSTEARTFLKLVRRPGGAQRMETVALVGCETFIDEEEQYLCNLLPAGDQLFYATIKRPDDREFYRSLDRRPTPKWRCFLINHSAPLTPDQMKVCLRPMPRETISQAEVFEALYSENEFKSALLSYYEFLSMLAERDQLIASIGAGASSEGFTAVLKEADMKIKRFRNEYFLGESESKTELLGPFEILPAGCAPAPAVCPEEFSLFRFSKTAGVVTVDNIFDTHAVTSPYKVNVPDKFGAPSGAAVRDAVDVLLVLKEIPKRNSAAIPESQLPGAIAAQGLDESGDRGFRYRVPASYFVSITTREENRLKPPLSSVPMMIAQRGKVVSLPASAGSWTTNYEIALYPSTGALKNFTLGSDALLQKSMFEDAEKAVTTITSANDELKRLERQQKILELQDKIRTLQKSLEDDDQ